MTNFGCVTYFRRETKLWDRNYLDVVRFVRVTDTYAPWGRISLPFRIRWIFLRWRSIAYGCFVPRRLVIRSWLLPRLPTGSQEWISAGLFWHPDIVSHILSSSFPVEFPRQMEDGLACWFSHLICSRTQINFIIQYTKCFYIGLIVLKHFPCMAGSVWLRISKYWIFVIGHTCRHDS